MGDIRDDQSIGWVDTYTVYHLIHAKFCENYKNLRTSLAAYFKMNEILKVVFLSSNCLEEEVYSLE